MFSFVFDVQNRSENRRKIVPWGRLGGPPGPSWGLPEAARARFRAQFTMNEKNERFCEFSGSSRDGPGDPGGAQKFAKKRFLAKKTAFRTCFFVDFCARSWFPRFLHDFPSIFLEKSMKDQWKNDAFFRIVACSFQHGDPHETLYFAMRKLFFHFSRFCVFSKKKSSKNVFRKRDHVFPSKITQKSSPGTRFGTQNGPELTSGRSKNRKMSQKNRFWTQ